ncbi:3'-5' exonuclease [Paenibacillus sp. KACC 21273]|uniref:HelD family protein n=1 Tax=Paenibacillus sp. KACC 21273 TaxID=3025665 RepID=UPI002365ED08|nr:3'-5' exonuclease [Paenibacillus sp. KACC 21273]WDF51989.1 3'-5' exonuclease [Paenibacillus sp. KACC 21273]
MEDNFQSAYQEEQDKLQQTVVEIDEQLERLSQIPVYTGHDFTEQILESGREQQRQSLSKSAQAPYFGRLDFAEGEEGTRQPLYIGKIGVGKSEVEDQPLVIDWRAPVASLFYSFTGGEEAAVYEAPEGLIQGLVYLKRNIVIHQRMLERLADTYDRESTEPAVTDEFLVYRLGENKDNKLRDIVSTIQAEQDRIIRAAKNTALVIQGVAGSGKTTVALHRLAFLLYQYQEQVSADKMIIFAPNHMFLDYISEVLPELGVGDIQQSTFSDWAQQILESDIRLVPQSETYEYWFENTDRPAVTDHTPSRYKGSLAFMQLIREYVNVLEQTAVPELDFNPWDEAVLSQQEILEWFNNEYKHYPLAKRKERVMARVHRWIEMQLKVAPSEAIRKERKKKAAQREKAYLNKWPKYEPLSLYKQLFKAIKSGNHAEALQSIWEQIPAEVLKQVSAELKKDRIREDDLPALVYIHTLLHEMEAEHRFDHVVMDEAQDFSPFHVALLDLYVRGSSFTILGDLSQGIHAYRGVHQWEEISDLFTPEQTDYFPLTRSYRSTMEIIEFANIILEKGVQNGITAVPVFRSGDPVRMIPCSTDTRLETIRSNWQQLQTKDYRTTAILTRTLHEAIELHQQLTEQGIEIHLIDGGKAAYQGGHSILPVYLSKGLEFDAVIVSDVDTDHYRNDAWDAKLLYVGCTRALHELWIMHGQQIPEYITSDTE